MKSEYYELIGILKCYIHGKQYNGKIDDQDKLTQLAQNHQVLPIVHHVLKNRIILPKAEASYFSQITNSVLRSKAEDCFSNLLENRQFIYYKGSVVAELHPIPQLRTMGDVDVLIHQEDREKVHLQLCQNEFVFTYKDEVKDGVWHYNKGNIEFEVHTFVLHPDELNDKHKDFFYDSWKYVSEDGQLDWNFHFLILIAHIREHIIMSGIGIRPFIDVALCQKR